MEFIRKNILSIAVALAIIAASFVTPSDLKKINVLKLHNADKIIHAVMYFVFTFTLFYENRRKLITKKDYFWLAFIPVVFGIAIEFLQPVISSSRSGEFTDGLYNISGVVIAVIIWYLINSRNTSSKNNISCF